MKDTEGKGIVRNIRQVAEVREALEKGEPVPAWFEPGDSFPMMYVGMNWRKWIAFTSWLEEVFSRLEVKTDAEAEEEEQY